MKQEHSIGFTLVSAQAICGFLGYAPASRYYFMIAIVAGVTIAIGYWKKKNWARQGAILIGILTVLGDAMELNGRIGKMVPIMRIALSATVVLWLFRPAQKKCCNQ